MGGEKCDFGDIVKEQVDKVEKRFEDDLKRLETEDIQRLYDLISNIKNRPPTWASAFIAFLTTALGVTVTIILQGK